MRSPVLMKSPAVPSSPFVFGEDGGCTFQFTLMRAENVDLGIDVQHGHGTPGLEITGVRPDCAIEAWNKQCVSGPSAGKGVMLGDTIESVNGLVDPESMLKECKEKRLLKIVVVRGQT